VACDEKRSPASGAGSKTTAYVRYLRALADAQPERFACHWYQWAFSWQAGGALVGDLVAREAIDGSVRLRSYDYVASAPASGRRRLAALAARWSPEQRAACVDEVACAFGAVRRVVGMISE
jgi:heme oxygenase